MSCLQKVMTYLQLKCNEVGVYRQVIITIEKYKYNPSPKLSFQVSEAFELDNNTVFKMKKNSRNTINHTTIMFSHICIDWYITRGRKQKR